MTSMGYWTMKYLINNRLIRADESLYQVQQPVLVGIGVRECSNSLQACEVEEKLQDQRRRPVHVVWGIRFRF